MCVSNYYLQLFVVYNLMQLHQHLLLYFVNNMKRAICILCILLFFPLFLGKSISAGSCTNSHVVVAVGNELFCLDILQSKLVELRCTYVRGNI